MFLGKYLAKFFDFFPFFPIPLLVSLAVLCSPVRFGSTRVVLRVEFSLRMRPLGWEREGGRGGIDGTRREKAPSPWNEKKKALLGHGAAPYHRARGHLFGATPSLWSRHAAGLAGGAVERVGVT